MGRYERGNKMAKSNNIKEELAALEERLLKAANEKRVHPDTLRSIIEDEKHPSTSPTLNVSNHIKDNSLAFGVVSDTCFNSQYQRLDLVHTTYRHFKESNVSFVLHCGNLIDKFIGKNQASENFIHLEYFDMISALKDWVPNIGVSTYYIGGRNEASYKGKKVFAEDDGDIVKIEADIPEDIAKVRKDLEFIGWHNARVKLTDKTTIAIASPPSGTRKPYTISHPMTSIVESYGGGEKPTIQLVGYYNKSWEGLHRGVVTIMVPTLQNSLPIAYSKAEPSHALGAYVLKLKFKEDGSLAQNGIKKVKIAFYD